MKQWFERFLQTPAGKVATGVLLVVAAWFVYSSIRNNLGDNDAVRLSKQRHFVCSETLKAFTQNVDEGSTWPTKSPFTGRDTGYPAEACYWTADGKVKTDPTWVLVNFYLGKSGPTFCPDCGRLVVAHNPFPNRGDAPPPTEAEYRARFRGVP